MPETNRHATRCALLLVAVAVFLPGLARAGCGCDHPPPPQAEVMPPFASPGKTISVYAVGGQFTPQQVYSVDFGGPTVAVTAEVHDRVQVSVPHGVAVGPVALRVTGSDYDHSYSDAAFTALSNPRKILDRGGVFSAPDHEAAVGADGTLYVALDVTSVRKAMQFTMAFLDLPLVYGADDVVIYNSDGVDLTLFTLGVADATERQWGSYYGWNVEDDSGLYGDWFAGQADDSDDIAEVSNLFTYWRHEFQTYADAHAPGGSHEVNAQGYHPDYTLHVDHYQLIIAIQGLERDSDAPHDASLATPLAPGSRQVDVGWVSIETPNPVELFAIRPLMDEANGPLAEFLEEVLFED